MKRLMFRISKNIVLFVRKRTKQLVSVFSNKYFQNKQFYVSHSVSKSYSVVFQIKTKVNEPNSSLFIKN